MHPIRVVILVVAMLAFGLAVSRFLPWRAGREPAIQTGNDPPSPANAAETIRERRSAHRAPSTKTLYLTEPNDDTGIRFKHCSGTSADKPFPSANGSGIAAFDYDLDGLYDLYFATGVPFPIDAGQREHRNRIYRNLGNWKFADVTEVTGLGHNGFSAGLPGLLQASFQLGLANCQNLSCKPASIRCARFSNSDAGYWNSAGHLYR